VTAFPDFFGNERAAHTLAHMIEQRRVAQTILLSGPEGVGKATLARRFAAALIGSPEKIERDDLSLPANLAVIEDREKWTSEQRADDPLLFSSHPDFVTFTPDGPLRQITMQQMRQLRERAQLKPLKGPRRLFLIDRLDRANEQSANSLLKVLEEPPDHVVILGTVENLYDTLPTIRSRSLILQLSRLDDSEMQAFAASRSLPDAALRISLAEGSPGIAARLDVEIFRARRDLVLSALECGAGLTTFADWVEKSEPFSSRKSEKLDQLLKLGYTLLDDILRTASGRTPAANRDVADRISRIASRVTFSWIERAARNLDELVLMVRRNIQKTSALDAFVTGLRESARGPQVLGTR
jgi:DNA polymerase-3 subunit delta'